MYWDWSKVNDKKSAKNGIRSPNKFVLVVVVHGVLQLIVIAFVLSILLCGYKSIEAHSAYFS